jgi:hypothetical protein
LVDFDHRIKAMIEDTEESYIGRNARVGMLEQKIHVVGSKLEKILDHASTRLSGIEQKDGERLRRLEGQVDALTKRMDEVAGYLGLPPSNEYGISGREKLQPAPAATIYYPR